MKIRERQRSGRPREAFGAHVTWTEWQVVDGRRVLSRWDFREQAEREVERLTALEGEKKNG